MSRVIFALVFLAVTALEAQKPKSIASTDGAVVLPRPELLKILGRSHLQLIADFYWLRTINLVLDAKTVTEGRALLALGGLITDLDPKFQQPYWTVALNAPVRPARGGLTWPNAPEAAALLKKGVSQYPRDNVLCIVLVQNLVSYQHDYLAAAEVLRARIALPGALPYFAPFATRLLAAGGQIDASREFAKAMLDSATDDETRKLFEERLKLIDLEEVLVAVESAAHRYHQEYPNEEPDVATLVAGGYLTQPPVDPFGGQIVIEKGRAFSTAVKRLEVLHEND